MALRLRLNRRRRRLYILLDMGLAAAGVGNILHGVLVGLIVLNVWTIILESVPSLDAQYHTIFRAIEGISLFIFTLEYLARLWTAVEAPPYKGMSALKARLSYALTPGAIIDFLAILPFFLAFLLPADDLRVLIILRLARFLKLTRYSPGMRALIDAVYNERRALFGSLIIVLGVVLISAALMHWAEHKAQPDKFGSIPEAAWWAVVTVTTLGYGDTVPITVVGKIIAGMTALSGMVLLSLPVGILATSFAETRQKRDFVVTLAMVARVPIFSELHASEIFEIMRVLRSKKVEAGDVIYRKGEMATALYFIAQGTVDVNAPNYYMRLTDGQFFGEHALIKRGPRQRTVTAVTPALLLILEAQDFQYLTARHPHLGEKIREISEARGSSLPDDGGLTNSYSQPSLHQF